MTPAMTFLLTFLVTFLSLEPFFSAHRYPLIPFILSAYRGVFGRVSSSVLIIRLLILASLPFC